MEATDFVPQDATIEVDASIHVINVKNFANKEKIVEEVRKSVNDYDARFVSQRDEWADDDTGVWNQCDAAFRCFVNDGSVQAQKNVGANEPDEWERAKVGTTQFFRQVTQMAANGYAVQSSRDMPFKYQPIMSETDVEAPDAAELNAKKLNLLAKWSMKKDRFNIKSIDFWTQVKKYGNIPVMVEWSHKKGKSEKRVPIIDPENPGVVSYEFEESDVVVENRPILTILPVEAVKADSVIGNIQDQECVIVSSIVGMSSIVDGIRGGYYRKDLLKDLEKSHQWDGYSGFENEDEKKDNRGFDGEPTTSNTGRYLKREVFINVPIDEGKGKWDEDKYVPMRYRVTMFGNNPNDSAVARIERNQEPDDTIPIEMIHANPDDSDMLYHISNYEVVRPNLAVETTIKRQIIDNNTLVCKPPLMEVQGEVQGNDRTFGPNTRFIVDNINSIKEFNVRDISQGSLGLLDYITEESNTANSIDKNMMGESFGARTSASEAGIISGNSSRPNLVNIEYVLEQFLGFYASRLKVNWEAYGMAEQIVQITDENDNIVHIKPREISGEFDIVIDIVDDIRENTVKTQRTLTYAQTLGQIPQLAQNTDWKLLAEVLGEQMMGTSKFVIDGGDGDAEENARRNVMLMLQQGIPPQINDKMNMAKHLEIYKQERVRFQGYEEQYPNIALLDQVIAQMEAQASQPQGQAQQQVVGEGEQNRQAISGAAGGI